jgi:hypothetical protein
MIAACAKPVVRQEKKEAPPIKKQEEISFKSFTYQGKAGEVFLAGNFNKWNINDPDFRFEKTEPEKWVLRVPEKELIRGKNEYKLIVDGKWMVDPNAPKVETEGLGGKIGVFILQ